MQLVRPVVPCLMQLAKDFATSVNGQPRAQRKPREYQPKPPRELNLPARRSGRNAGAPAPNYNENALDMIRETTTGVRLPDRHGEPKSTATDLLYAAPLAVQATMPRSSVFIPAGQVRLTFSRHCFSKLCQICT